MQTQTPVQLGVWLLTLAVTKGAVFQTQHIYLNLFSSQDISLHTGLLN